MYIWKVSALIEELKTDGLSSKEQLKYFLIYSILMTLATDPIFYIDFEYVVFDVIDSIIYLLFTALGILYCYKINSKADSKDFILRFITLGLPITIRFIVFFSLIMVIYYSFVYVDDSEIITTKPIDNIFSLFFLISYYYYFSLQFKKFIVE